MISFFKLGLTSKATSRGISGVVAATLGESQEALAKVRELWSSGQLREALLKVDEIEEKYPSCTKAAKHFRGKIGLELLEKSGSLSHPVNIFKP